MTKNNIVELYTKNKTKKDGYIRRKTKIRKKRNISLIKSILKIVMFIILVFVCVYEYNYLVKKSGIFNVSDVIVGGNYTLTKNEIIDLSGIRLLGNIYKIDTKQIEKRLKLEPKIEDVSVERINFNKIRILIKERKDFATVQVENTFYIIDNNGIIIKKDEIDSLPFITGFSKVIDQDNMKKISSKKIKVAKKWIELFNKLDIISTISEINIKDIFECYIYTKNGIKIYIGNDLKRFSFIFPYLKKEIEKIVMLGKNVEYIDVRFNDEIAIKYVDK